jgi:hypothetical protein
MPEHVRPGSSPGEGSNRRLVRIRESLLITEGGRAESANVSETLPANRVLSDSTEHLPVNEGIEDRQLVASVHNLLYRPPSPLSVPPRDREPIRQTGLGDRRSGTFDHVRADRLDDLHDVVRGFADTMAGGQRSISFEEPSPAGAEEWSRLILGRMSSERSLCLRAVALDPLRCVRIASSRPLWAARVRSWRSLELEFPVTVRCSS